MKRILCDGCDIDITDDYYNVNITQVKNRYIEMDGETKSMHLCSECIELIPINTNE